jgi:hypothetical protein
MLNISILVTVVVQLSDHLMLLACQSVTLMVNGYVFIDDTISTMLETLNFEPGPWWKLLTCWWRPTCDKLLCHVCMSSNFTTRMTYTVNIPAS